MAPITKLVPRNDDAVAGLSNWNEYGPPTPGTAEQVYFMQLAGDASGQTTAMLHDAAGSTGVAISYDVNQLPCFSLWKNTVAEENGYVTGLEPATNFPNPRTFEGQHDRAVKLEPSQSVSYTHLTLPTTPYV